MNFKTLSFLFAGALAIASCTSKPAGEEAATTTAAGTTEVAAPSATATSYAVATTSTLGWAATKVGGAHNGQIPVTGGSLMVDGANITGGTIDINVDGLTCTDLTEKTGKGDLEKHLKAADFFDTAKFPTASFTITKVEPVAAGGKGTHTVTGDLKMKDKTNSITFPMTVAIADGKLTATTEQFTIDRLKWGVQYNSSTLAGTAKDKVINDQVGISLNITAATGAAAPAVAPAPAAH
jgi:polyisoprenoid-binding protein YceI